MKLGDISPAAGIATGEGLMGDLASKGVLGALPYMLTKDKRKALEEEKEKEKQRQNAMGNKPARAVGMREGGETSKAKKKSSSKPRGCGCAKKGVRKAKMY